MPGFFESLLILPVLGWGALWIWALVDIGSRDDGEFRAVGESKAIWFVVVLVLQFFGLLGYLIWTRPKLTSSQRT